MEKEENKEAGVVVYQTDFSKEENQALTSYIQNGCPGLAKVDETKTFEWFQLYMAGKSYGEIASICNAKKDTVLYIANKLKWHEKRMTYYSDITSNLLNKTKAVKMESANTIASMVSAMSSYFGDKFVNYIKTKDPTHIEKVDTKMLAQYYKSLEMLDKLVPDGQPAVPPAPSSVNVNVSSSATIEQTEDGKITITDNSAKEVLAALAKYKKKLADDEEG